MTGRWPERHRARAGPGAWPGRWPQPARRRWRGPPRTPPGRGTRSCVCTRPIRRDSTSESARSTCDTAALSIAPGRAGADRLLVHSEVLHYRPELHPAPLAWPQPRVAVDPGPLVVQVQGRGPGVLDELRRRLRASSGTVRAAAGPDELRGVKVRNVPAGPTGSGKARALDGSRSRNAATS